MSHETRHIDRQDDKRDATRPDLRIEKLTRHGIQLLQEERALALKGDFSALAELNPKKIELLEQMEAISAQLSAGGPEQLRAARRQELETLFDIVRRRAAENQYLLKAAESGVKSARRKLDVLTAVDAPVGAYGRGGEPIDTSARANVRSEPL